MQRFLALGQARLHVLEAGIHDPAEAQRIRGTLDGLRPTRIWLDLSSPEFVAITQGSPPGRFDKRLLRVGAQCGPVDPFIVYRAIHDWAGQHQVPLRFLLTNSLEPRRRDMWKLDRLLKREGFEAGDPTSAVRRLHLHYVSRVPELVAWLHARWTQASQNLLAAEHVAGSGGLLITAVPDGSGIADLVQRGSKP